MAICTLFFTKDFGKKSIHLLLGYLLSANQCQTLLHVIMLSMFGTLLLGETIFFINIELHEEVRLLSFTMLQIW